MFRKMRKIGCLVLAVLMVVTLVPGAALAESTDVAETFDFEQFEPYIDTFSWGEEVVNLEPDFFDMTHQEDPDFLYEIGFAEISDGVIVALDESVEMLSEQRPNTHRNTGNQRSDIVAVARTQVGYNGGSSATKYTRFVTGGNTWQDWCAHFVVWTARQANIGNNIIRTTGWADWQSDGLNVPFHRRGSGYNPQPGDLVFFLWQAPYNTGARISDHVGILEAVHPDGSLTVIEGNANNRVQRLTYSPNGQGRRNIRHISGFGVPRYVNESPQVQRPSTPVITRTSGSGWHTPGNTFTINYSSQRATAFDIYIRKWNGRSYEMWNPNTNRFDNNHFVSRGSATNFSFRPTAIGCYVIWVVAYNAAGSSEAPIFFTVSNGFQIASWYSDRGQGYQRNQARDPDGFFINRSYFLWYELYDQSEASRARGQRRLVTADFNLDFQVALSVTRPDGTRFSGTYSQRNDQNWLRIPGGNQAGLHRGTITLAGGHGSGTFTRNFTIPAVTIRFRPNGGTGTMADQVFPAGSTQQPLRRNTFTRSGHTFQGWANSPTGEVILSDGNLVSNGNGRISETFNLYAIWRQQAPQQITITATASPSNGGTVTGGGRVNQGSSVTLRATPNSGWTFDGWFEGGTRVSSNATWTFTANANRTLQARFVQQPQQTPTPTPTPPTPTPTPPPVQRVTITTSASPSNGGSVTGGGTVNQGTSVTLRAMPNIGWAFDGWFDGGTRVSTNATWTFTADANRTVQARFVNHPPPGQQVTIALSASPSNGGTVTGGGRVNQGTSVTLRATPNTGWTFDGWFEGGTRVNSNATWTFTANADRTLQARFVQQQQSPPPTTSIHPFTDVRPSDWFYDAVGFLYHNRIMIGASATTFDPHVTLNRAMVATILWRIEGEPHVPFRQVFSDVAPGRWYSTAVVWAFDAGVVRGVGEGRFAPNALISRQELAVMVHRYEQSWENVHVPGHVPVPPGTNDWAHEAMRWATFRGFIGSSNPPGSANRAETAVFIHLYLLHYWAGYLQAASAEQALPKYPEEYVDDLEYLAEYPA